MVEYIISGSALILSIIALRRTSKAKKFEVKHKYLEELYEVRTKANRVRTGTERQIAMIDGFKHISTYFLAGLPQLKSKYESDGEDIPARLLEAEENLNKAVESILENEKSCKEYYEKIKNYENDLEILASNDNPKDKDFTDIHKLKTLIQLRINEQEANYNNIRESYNFLFDLYYKDLAK